MYVLDASVYAPLILQYGAKLIKRLREMKITTLDLAIYEACNVFWKQHTKAHKIDRNEAIVACKVSKALTRYIILYKITDLDIEEAVKIAIDNNITFYDASYIALAKKLNTPIATEDKDIKSAAPNYNIKVLNLQQLINILEKKN